MTETQAYDLGHMDGYAGEIPMFRGPWNLFDAYHRGYSAGLKDFEEEQEEQH
jgi:hypothetical protein